MGLILAWVYEHSDAEWMLLTEAGAGLLGIGLLAAVYMAVRQRSGSVGAALAANGGSRS